MERNISRNDECNKMDLRKLEEELTRTSFPLELRCNYMLQKRNWDVMNNFIFEDPEQQKHREIDVFACDAPTIFNDKRCMTIYVLIECKKSKYPWVFFPSSKRNDRVILGLHNMIFRDGETKRTHEGSDSLVSDLMWNSRFFGSEISSWFFETENKKHDIHDAISKLAKATYYATVGQREEQEPLHPPLLYVVYQAIVFDGLLCNASLRGERIRLSPTEHVMLGMNFICPSFRTQMLIDVVHAGYFSEYIRTIEAERDKFVEIANNFYYENPRFEAVGKSELNKCP